MIATIDLKKPFLSNLRPDMTFTRGSATFIIEFKTSTPAQKYLEKTLNESAWYKLLLAKDGKITVDECVSELSKEAKKYNVELTGDAFALLGDLYNLNGNYRTAINYYKKAQGLGNGDPGIIANFAIAYMHIDEFNEAKVLLDALTQNHPDYALGWHSRGHVYGSLKKYDEAITFFDKAIGLKPGLLEAWHCKAIVFYWKGNPDKAIEVCDTIIKSFPKDAGALYIKATALVKLNRYDEALMVLEPLEKNDDSFAMYGKALIFESQGNLFDALLNLELSLSIKEDKGVREKYEEVRKEADKKADLTQFRNCIKIEIPPGVDPTDWNQFSKLLYNKLLCTKLT